MKETKPNPKTGVNRLIPFGETKCIWMTAGILNYKLCTRDFECGDCPLDQAFRKEEHMAPPEHPSVTPRIPKRGEMHLHTTQLFIEDILPTHQEMKKELYYSPKFTWFQHLDDGQVRIGIDPFLLKLLGPIKSIVLPAPGSRIRQNEYFCWIFGNDYEVIPLVAPLNGMVIGVRKQLQETPQHLLEINEPESWLIEVKPNHFKKDRKILSYGETQYPWREKQTQFLREQLEITVEKDSVDIGLTLPDGGVPLKDIKNIVGNKKYYEIVIKFVTSVR